MKQIALLIFLILMLIAPAIAAETDGNVQVGEDELVAMVLAFLSGGSGAPDLAAVQDAAAAYRPAAGIVTDSSGRTHAINAAPSRIVVMNGETLETLRSLGVDPSIVIGIDKYSAERPSFFPEYAGTAVVGSIWSPDYEAIVSLRPDAVFLYATTSKDACDEIQKKLEDTIPGVQVFRFDCYHPGTYAPEIRALGTIFDRKAEAAAFAAFYTGTLDIIPARLSGVAEADRTRVYLENWKDYKTGSSGSGYEEKIRMAGGRNVFSALQTEYPEIDPEAVIGTGPDVIVKLIGAGSYDAGGYDNEDVGAIPGYYTGLTERSGWKALSAVKNGNVHLLHNDIFGGPEHFIGVVYMAKWCYPEVFADIDPAEIHRRYLTEYQRLAIDFSGDIFTYP
ncbi:MAG TPA: ABC transporter substrate-binding protein [Methanofollis liminatans]|uniref:ABC transporter substrate-binding protein n=1 Tax=Methanofollis liminatans TaxID=2201 RepID=A0A831M3L2_9EURY|nr:ABC transporter substrate-binding protein [Methanofollis liminatans]